MEPGFFRSKEFIVGAGIGVLLIAGAVVATSSFDDVTVHIQDGCSVDVGGERSLSADVEDTGARRSGSGGERVVTYTADASGLAGGMLALCTEIGDIEVTSSPDDTVRATFTIVHRGDRGTDAVEQTRVEAIFINDDGRLNVAAFQASRAQVRSWFDSQSTSVRLQLEVPDGAAYDVDAHTDVGDIVMTSIELRSVEAHTDVGDIDGAVPAISSWLDARSDVGDITLVVSDVGSGSWELRTDVGDVDLRLPAASDVGYEVNVETDVGHAEVDVGDTESFDAESDGPSHEVYARTADFSGKAKQVHVNVRTDVGRVLVQTTGVAS